MMHACGNGENSPDSTDITSPTPKKVVVMGGGIAGCLSALELAKAGYQVILLECRSDLLRGSSDRTPCRLGLGFHYADFETAKKYYQATRDLLKKYKKQFGIDLRLSMNLPNAPSTSSVPPDNDDPLYRGRYFIVKDTTIEAARVFQIYHQLKELYRQDIEDDPENKLFGEPETFYKLISIDEIGEGVVNAEKVCLGIETAECILNWPLLRQKILEGVETESNIRVVYGAHVEKVSTFREFSLESYKVEYSFAGKTEVVSADIVVNSTWEDIERINQKLSIPMRERTNRLKIMVEVELPSSLQRQHCMFFCFGPHCSFTNYGNGRGFITAERYTNHEFTRDIELPQSMKALLYGLPDSADSQEKEELEAFKIKIAEQILLETSTYIPDVTKAKICAVYTGVVRTFGKIDRLDDADSPINQRRESGVEDHSKDGYPYFIDNASMKLLYGQANGKEVIDVINKTREEVELAMSAIRDITEKIVRYPCISFVPTATINYGVMSMFFSEKRGDGVKAKLENFTKQIQLKENVTKEIPSHVGKSRYS